MIYIYLKQYYYIYYILGNIIGIKIKLCTDKIF